MKRISLYGLFALFVISLMGCGEAISGPDLDQNASCNPPCHDNDGSWTNSGFE